MNNDTNNRFQQRPQRGRPVNYTGARPVRPVIQPQQAQPVQPQSVHTKQVVPKSVPLAPVQQPVTKPQYKPQPATPRPAAVQQIPAAPTQQAVISVNLAPVKAKFRSIGNAFKSGAHGFGAALGAAGRGFWRLVVAFVASRPLKPVVYLVKRYKVPVAAMSAGLIVGAIGYGYMLHHSSVPVSLLETQKELATASATAGVAVKKTSGKPSFTPLVPEGKPQYADPAKSAAVYNKEQDSYSYKDLFAGTPLSMGQQKLPDGYSTPTEAVKAVADSIGAGEPIATKYGTAYMATDETKKSQTLVASGKGLLIIIKSDYPHSVNIWAEYLNSLN